MISIKLPSICSQVYHPENVNRIYLVKMEDFVEFVQEKVQEKVKYKSHIK